jgi:foldase protein PrsA
MVNQVEKNNNKSVKFNFWHMIAINIVFLLVVILLLVIYINHSMTVVKINSERISQNQLFKVMFAHCGEGSIEQLITQVLIEQEGKRLGLKVTDDEIDREIKFVIDEYLMGDEDEFYNQLILKSISLDTYRNDIYFYILSLKITSPQVTESEAREFFENNKAIFMTHDMVEVRHILTATEEEALEVISGLEQGIGFTQMASERSLCSATKDTGGYLGFFSRESGAMTEFEEAAFTLAIGERSEPVHSWLGYHVIEVLDRKDGKIVTYEDVEDRVKEIALEDITNRMIKELIDRLRSEANIIYY